MCILVVSMYGCVCLYLCVCVYVYVHLCAFVHMWICFFCMYVYSCVCVCGACLCDVHDFCHPNLLVLSFLNA